MSTGKMLLHNQRIALALSGGGVRAAAFHAGVLRWMAEEQWLERVTALSTVSGGSLFAGLVFAQAGNRWPSSEDYRIRGYAEVRGILTQSSLSIDALLRLANPLNWRFFLSRANVFAISIRKKWGITAQLKDLPPTPVWSINGTTAENGRRFRFKGDTVGDYEIGYAKAGKMLLAEALAVSAAFPGGIGPLTLDTSKYQWMKKEVWDDEADPQIIHPPFSKLHLYDGGLYDNLGMEPFFDVGKGNIKKNCGADFIVIADAGAPYKRSRIPGPLHPKRLLRTLDIVMGQARALRVRPFIRFLQSSPESGRYYQIGSSVHEQIKNGLVPKENLGQDPNEFLSDAEIARAKGYPTTLLALGEADFDLIARHGYETAKWNNHVKDTFRGSEFMSLKM
ncbi:patatin-like phospholipase family protein [Geothrix oryzisoli]|uniref:patatin-like phospholipase family protein n=1 Tax=Geothrix oryzisoli TaxID=2922721 RepID=UPI001FABF845|nr:patatin-like phospholipase family protein [Geothrix oryzisoli]